MESRRFHSRWMWVGKKGTPYDYIRHSSLIDRQADGVGGLGNRSDSSSTCTTPTQPLESSPSPPLGNLIARARISLLLDSGTSYSRTTQTDFKVRTKPDSLPIKCARRALHNLDGYWVLSPKPINCISTQLTELSVYSDQSTIPPGLWCNDSTMT